MIKLKMMQTKIEWFLKANKLAFAVVVLAVLNACSSGSGSDNSGAGVSSSTNNGGSGGLDYQGPLSSTPAVEQFQEFFWRPMINSSDITCTECHQQDGDGTGWFVRDDDVNLAYAAAFDRVDLSLPANSLLVQRVSSGHGCWLSDPGACATVIQGLITDWALESGSEISEISLVPPTYSEPGSAKNFPPLPTDPPGSGSGSGGFQEFIWEAFTRLGGAADNPSGYCSQCHSEDSTLQQQPWHGHANPATAYQEAKGLINLDTPSASRLVTKVRGGHNCWTPSDCNANANALQAAIEAYADTIDADEIPEEWNVSGAVNLEDDGIEAVTGGRVENNRIAAYTFVAPQSASTGNGTASTVFDVSGISPTADLRNVNAGSGITWSGSRGVRIDSGRLQTTIGSEKFRDLIGLTGEYSIETWVAPENVVQDNSSRIVTYSQDLDNTNFILGQTLYNYDFFNRSTMTDVATGGPAYSTPDADEVLQATLQHVVVTFDPSNGRKIYVNGREANPTPDPDIDPDNGVNISNWSNNFVLGVGAEPGNLRQWKGSMRMLVIHNRALTPEDIENNFQVGVGAKFFMMFDLSNAEAASGGLIPSSIPQAYVVFEVEVFDAKSYLFTNPFFISLDSSWTPSGETLTFEGMRIGINAKEAPLGQAYSKMSFTIDDANYSPTGQLLSQIGTLIPIELGPQSRTDPTAGGDVFFLTFDRIGIASDYIRPVETIPPIPTVGEIPDLDPASDIGIKHFHKLNEAMSAATGVNKGATEVRTTFSNVSRSLPANQGIREFQAAHQMSIVQLGAEYCLDLTDNNPGFYAPFNFSAPANTAFGGAGATAEKDQIIDPLLDAITAQVVTGLGTELASQPDNTAARGILEEQIDDMVNECGGSCDTTDTASIVMATCTAVMSSAALLIQ